MCSTKTHGKNMVKIWLVGFATMLAYFITPKNTRTIYVFPCDAKALYSLSYSPALPLTVMLPAIWAASEELSRPFCKSTIWAFMCGTFCVSSFPAFSSLFVARTF